MAVTSTTGRTMRRRLFGTDWRRPSTAAPRSGSDLPTTNITTMISTNGRASGVPTSGSHVHLPETFASSFWRTPIISAAKTVTPNDVNLADQPGRERRDDEQREPGRA